MALTNRQKLLAELEVANPDWTQERLAKEMNCSVRTIYQWHQIPEFAEYEHEVCQKKFKALERSAIKAMQNLIESDSFQASKYILDYLQYAASQKIEADVKGETTINVNIEEDE